MEGEKWRGAVPCFPLCKTTHNFLAFHFSKKTTTNTAMQSQETNKQMETAPSWWQSDDAWAMMNG